MGGRLECSDPSQTLFLFSTEIAPGGARAKSAAPSGGVGIVDGSTVFIHFTSVLGAKSGGWGAVLACPGGLLGGHLERVRRYRSVGSDSV